MSATANEPSSTRTPPFERILCVTGPTPQGAEAVRQATVLAAPSGTIDLVTAGVVEYGAYHDLIVVPDSATGLDVLPRAAASVLIARAPSAPTPFPETILIAVDGTAEAHAAARVGAELAVRQPLSCRWSPRRSTIRAIRMRWSRTSKSWSRSPASGRSCSTSTAARHRRSWLRQPASRRP